jgi:hypothetical protein
MPARGRNDAASSLRSTLFFRASPIAIKKAGRSNPSEALRRTPNAERLEQENQTQRTTRTIAPAVRLTRAYVSDVPTKQLAI